MEKKEHPSYGVIRICRSSVGGQGVALFGSSIMHNNLITLSISRGMMERESNEDRFYPKESMKDRVIEVEMSYAQFAEAITSLNIAQGVPVTITKLNGEMMPRCPYENRQKVMRKEMDETVLDMVKNLDTRTKEIEQLLSEKRVLSKEDRSSIVGALKSVRQTLKSEIPFLQELYAEQMDKTVLEAKGEFETYLQNKMNHIALTAMSEQTKLREIEMGNQMLPEEQKQEEEENPEETEGMQMNM